MTGPVPPVPQNPAAHPLATPLDAAEMLTARGWVVFPADNPDAGLACTGTARRCVERRCGAQTDPRKRGKHPRVDRWGGLGVASAAQLAEWFDEHAGPVNVALACGPSGLMVIDEDTEGSFAAFCASNGEAVPDTFRVRTGRGWHWYFVVPVDPGTGERYRIGNSPGALGAWHCDVRGGASASAEHGGYVITAGSRHWSGITYTAPEPYAVAVDAPPWLIAAVLAPYQAPPSGDPAGTGAAPVDGGEADRDGDRRAAGSGATVPPGGGPAGSRAAQGVARWDKEIRYGSLPDLWAQYRRHCAEVRHTGAEFRHELFRAARDGWRLVNKGAHDQDAMLDELAECVARVWHAEPDDRDAKIVYEEALHGPSGALASPWEIIEPLSRRPAEIEPGHLFTRPGEVVNGGVTSADTRSADHTSGQHAVTDVTEGERLTEYECKVVAEVERLDVRAEAVRVRTARDLAPITGTDAVTFFAGDPPDYLIPGMIHRDGIAVMFGAPHCGKTFIALDIALSLASGKPWAGGEGSAVALPDGSPGVVHYIMAEAPGTNIGRGNAWMKYHGITPADLQGRLIAVTEPFTLTEAQVPLYLPRVIHDKPNLIVFDTRAAMFGGKESQAEDYTEMVRALRAIREAADGCALLLIDHSGLHAPDRIRGSNAWEGATDSIVKVAKDKETGHHYMTMDRDRTAPEGGPEWEFRRERVRVCDRDEAVLIAVPRGESAPPLHMPGWEADLPLPTAGTEKIDAARVVLRGGKTQAHPGRPYAKVIWQLLRSTEGDPLLQTRIRTMVNDVRTAKKDHLQAWAISRGCRLLVDEGMAYDVGTPAVPRYVVAPAYGKREMPE